MKINTNIKPSYLLCLFVMMLIINSCLEDSMLTPVDYTIATGAEFLFYLEERGDFVNSFDAPGLILAEEVNGNLNNYLILDIRSSNDFINGHIPGAVNLSNSQLLGYIQNNPASSKIVLVCKTGQASSYYCCLLRLYGFGNIYALKFGMASWHSDFSALWFSAARNTSMLDNFVNIDYPKNPITNLPPLIFTNHAGTVEEKLEERITQLMEIEFVANNYINISTELSLTLDKLYNNYQPIDSTFTGYYIVCLGNQDMYIDHAQGRLWEDGHPPTTVLIRAVPPHFEMRSGKLLQTLPQDGRTIALYCYDGHLSACFTAYLRLLGYNTKSILFGYNTMYHDRMLRYPVLAQKAFRTESIGNYSYEINE